MGTTEDTLNQLKREAFAGGLGKASAEILDGYAAALCHPQAFTVFSTHEFPQVSETVRIHLLRAHIARLQTHITALDAKNTRLTKWVIALAVAALISTLIQTIGTGIQTKVALETFQPAKLPPQQRAQSPSAPATQAPVTVPARTPSSPASAPKQP